MYYPGYIGINFCGYIVHKNYMLIRNRSKKEIIKKIKIWNRLYNAGELNLIQVRLSFNSWLSHVKHASSYNLVKRYISYIIFDILNVRWTYRLIS